MTRVIALIATIPSRRKSCERLLSELANQSRIVDGVALVLDGYAKDPEPKCGLPVVAISRTPKLSGAGQRWKMASYLLPSDIIICIDDDTMLIEAPDFVKNLVDMVETNNCAAAAMGRTPEGKQVLPSNISYGRLIYGAGCGLTLRAGWLEGHTVFAKEVRDKGGPDALGLLGDDDALISAFLDKQEIRIEHVGIGNFFAAPGTNTSSQTRLRLARGEKLSEQKFSIAKITGWNYKVN